MKKFHPILKIGVFKVFLGGFWTKILSKHCWFNRKQGRIHGNPVADGWAGAVMLKPLGIQKGEGRMDLPIDRRTRQGVESRVRD